MIREIKSHNIIKLTTYLQLIDKKLLPKKIKKSFFSVVRAEFRLAAIYLNI